MDDTDRFRLRFGPYRMPRCRVGRWLRCRLRSRVKVVGISDTPIPWPQTRHGSGGPPFLIFTGDVVRAVRRESNQAIAYHWGVTAQTVSVWRKALGEPRGNEGTCQLQSDWSPERFTPEVREASRKPSRSAERAAKISAARKGKARPRHVIEAIRRAVKGHESLRG